MDQLHPTDTEENYDRFIAEAMDTGLVWALNEKGQEEGSFALCPSEVHKSSDVMPFWSAQEFAEVHCVDEWAVYEPIAIDFGEFMEDWLDGLHEDGVLIGINWNADMEGPEVEPLDLASDIEEQL
ncbi:MAG: DUF2750 domain-containing protein [Cellvibrionaceae bacterium]